MPSCVRKIGCSTDRAARDAHRDRRDDGLGAGHRSLRTLHSVIAGRWRGSSASPRDAGRERQPAPRPWADAGRQRARPSRDAGVIPGEVEAKLRAVEGVTDAEVELVWDPPWDASRMSEAARLELGFM
jgi:hypothetical protein